MLRWGRSNPGLPRICSLAVCWGHDRLPHLRTGMKEQLLRGTSPADPVYASPDVESTRAPPSVEEDSDSRPVSAEKCDNSGVSDRKMRSGRRTPEGPSPRRGCRGQPVMGYGHPNTGYWLDLRDIPAPCILNMSDHGSVSQGRAVLELLLHW